MTESAQNSDTAGGATAPKYILKPVEDLAANPRNARTHSEAQIKKIAASIRRFGFINPIIIDNAGEIIAGHGRLEGAKALGIAEVPCLIASHLSDAEKRAYMLADNRIALESGWDESLLKIELSELAALDFDLDLTGFDTPEIDSIINPKPPVQDFGKAGSLADKFLVAPFSVLNAREGWWQNRKRAWLAKGIRSELGRGENLLKMSDACNNGGYKAGPAKAFNTTDWVKEKGLSGLGQDVAKGSGTSIFDPVLCELAYSWFCPPQGLVLDPFAGGSVRGLVAGEVRGPDGAYYDFVGDTVEAFRAAGLAFYNEAILITAAGSLPIRAGKQFTATRKLGKTHQNVLVFLKGDARKAVAACGDVVVAVPDEPKADEGYGEPL